MRPLLEVWVVLRPPKEDPLYCHGDDPFRNIGVDQVVADPAQVDQAVLPVVEDDSVRMPLYDCGQSEKTRPSKPETAAPAIPSPVVKVFVSSGSLYWLSDAGGRNALSS